MPTTKEKVAAFRALHKKGSPLIAPNPWDAGSARILESLGFKALATTSSGFALTLGRPDYGVTREEAIGHGRIIAGAVDIPVSADLENGFGATPEDAATTIREAAKTGLAGGSIEDSTTDADEPIFEKSLAVERIAAAADAARAAKDGFVLTARAEGYLYGRGELKEIISRLQAFEEAGADVLFAPGLPDMDAVKAVCSSVGKPVNVLVIRKLLAHSVDDFAAAGVARLSTGGALAFSVYGSLVPLAEAMLKDGSFKAPMANIDAVKRIRGFLR
ncbi:MAG: isocitrate lyase/phosphoenolpyruvate mutase family protein [Parvularculaceae bacterium]